MSPQLALFGQYNPAGFTIRYHWDQLKESEHVSVTFHDQKHKVEYRFSKELPSGILSEEIVVWMSAVMQAWFDTTPKRAQDLCEDGWKALNA